MKRLFPNDADYTAVYDRFGLSGLIASSPTAFIFRNASAHVFTRRARRSSTVRPPIPSWARGSSSIANLRKASRPVSIGLATDVGGGTSYSMLATMAEAHKVAMLRGDAVDRRRALSHGDLWQCRASGSRRRGGRACRRRLCRSGGARSRATPVLASRDDLSQSLEDRLFALALLGDDRAVRATYVAGKRMYQRKITP